MDPAADVRFTRMYETHYDQVLAYCGRRVSRADAEDIANEVFVVLWRRLDHVEQATATAWLYGVAYRIMGDRFRKAKRRARISEQRGSIQMQQPAIPDEVIVQREQDRIVIESLGELKPADAETLRLSAWEELTAPEIAVAMDCSVAAAEQRIHRAKKRLAKVLANRLPAHATPTSTEKGGRT